MVQLAPFIWLTATAVIIAVVIIAFLNYLLKRKIVESGRLDDNYLKLMQKPADGGSSLKWGILLFFSGVGLVVMEYLPYYADQSPIPWGVEMIFIAAGFLCYYLAMKAKK